MEADGTSSKLGVVGGGGMSGSGSANGVGCGGGGGGDDVVVVFLLSLLVIPMEKFKALGFLFFHPFYPFPSLSLSFSLYPLATARSSSLLLGFRIFVV